MFDVDRSIFDSNFRHFHYRIGCDMHRLAIYCGYVASHYWRKPCPYMEIVSCGMLLYLIIILRECICEWFVHSVVILNSF